MKKLFDILFLFKHLFTMILNVQYMSICNTMFYFHIGEGGYLSLPEGGLGESKAYLWYSFYFINLKNLSFTGRGVPEQSDPSPFKIRPWTFNIKIKQIKDVQFLVEIKVQFWRADSYNENMCQASIHVYK